MKIQLVNLGFRFANHIAIFSLLFFPKKAGLLYSVYFKRTVLIYVSLSDAK